MERQTKPINPLLARGRDRLETAGIDFSHWQAALIPLLARGRDRLETCNQF